MVAVIAAIVADEDLKRRVADAMGLDEDAAQFLWLCLDSAIRADSFLRSAITEQRLDAMIRDRALALIDATDSIVRIAQPQEEP